MKTGCCVASHTPYISTFRTPPPRVRPLPRFSMLSERDHGDDLVGEGTCGNDHRTAEGVAHEDDARAAARPSRTPARPARPARTRCARLGGGRGGAAR